MNMNEKAELHFIGVVEKIDEQEARIRLFPEFCPGLKNIETYSHLIILYWFHLRDKAEERRIVQVTPRKHHPDVPEVGVFASRSPSRPNPIGLCIVELKKIENCTLFVKELDAFEGSPIIDIKPYLPKADSISEARVPPWTLHGPAT